MGKLRQALRADLESAAPDRAFGTGWFSGVVGLALSLLGLGLVVALSLPGLFSMPMLHDLYAHPGFRLALHLILIAGFALAVLNLILRQQKIMGFAAATAVLVATLLGGSHVESTGALQTGYYIGLDWFLVNLTLLGIVFIPLERLFARVDQSIFRFEWRADLFYFLINSLLVQVLTWLSLAPATTLTAETNWTALRALMASQPLWLQVIEIMILTDLVQYWLHRSFHRIPFLWNFHAVHHSTRAMDWLAGSRMHVMEIVVLRGVTVIPMYVLGYDPWALKIYILYVYLHSTFIHSNVRFDLRWLRPFIATPQFHHWHHGIEKEAIDVNFAVQFPFLDRLFGTHHLPGDRWPSGYGVGGHPVPAGYLKQFAYPFSRA